MPTAMRRTLIKDAAGALAFIVLCGVFLRELGDVPPAAAKYPAALIYMIFALCAILLARCGAGIVTGRYGAGPAAATADDQSAAACAEPDKFGFPTVFVLALSLLYVLVMPYVGFIVASAAMLLVFMLVMGVRSVPVLVLVPTLELVFLWYVFEKLLTVFLPDAYWLRSVLGLV